MEKKEQPLLFECCVRPTKKSKQPFVTNQKNVSLKSYYTATAQQKKGDAKSVQPVYFLSPESDMPQYPITGKQTKAPAPSTGQANPIQSNIQVAPGPSSVSTAVPSIPTTISSTNVFVPPIPSSITAPSSSPITGPSTAPISVSAPTTTLPTISPIQIANPITTSVKTPAIIPASIPAPIPIPAPAPAPATIPVITPIPATVPVQAPTSITLKPSNLYPQMSSPILNTSPISELKGASGLIQTPNPQLPGGLYNPSFPAPKSKAIEDMSLLREVMITHKSPAIKNDKIMLQLPTFVKL